MVMEKHSVIRVATTVIPFTLNRCNVMAASKCVYKEESADSAVRRCRSLQVVFDRPSFFQSPVAHKLFYACLLCQDDIHTINHMALTLEAGKKKTSKLHLTDHHQTRF
jgi:hypothetical protein